MPRPPAARPSATIRVALFYPWRPGNSQEFLRGILRYARPHKPWEFCLTVDRTFDAVESSRPDGIIGHFFAEDAIERARRLSVPVVDTALDFADSGLPQVGLDDDAVGVAGAEHLLERGFGDVLFVGDETKEFSRRTRAGFERRMADRRPHVICAPAGLFPASPEMPWPPSGASAEWLRSLPSPLAAFAAGDALALQLLETGRSIGQRVPEDLAVLGAGNIELLCSLAYPPLSSVRVPGEAAGFEAARLLDHLLSGGSPPRTRLELPPVGVVTRQSTDLLAVSDQALAAALRYIQTHLQHPIGVMDVATAARLSRSSLERRFRDILGRSPADEIRRRRLARARQLLIETDEPMTEVAERTGFRDSGHLSELFRHDAGEPPTAFRRRFRAR